MKLNVPARGVKTVTHEGGRAVRPTARMELERAVASCLLWEDTFYENGVSIADRIKSLVPQVDAPTVESLAIKARTEYKLRHVPLLLVREMARHEQYRPYVRGVLPKVILRADELAEFLALYWKDGKQPLAASVKKGLADAFQRFSAYDLAKYNRDNAIKLRDVMFMVHPKPKGGSPFESRSNYDKVSGVARGKYTRGIVRRHKVGQGKDWKDLVDGTLATPDTWEVALSAKDGVARKDKWERLLAEKRMGALAVLRNLRNMQTDGVREDAIRSAIVGTKAEMVLPFRFIAAARYAPKFEPELEQKMFESVENVRMKGRTLILVDVSGSMNSPLSAKSDMLRLDAAYGVAMLGKEIFEQADVFSFSYNAVEIPNRRGFALRDAIDKSQPHGGTYLADSANAVFASASKRGIKYERVVVITDEQSHDGPAVLPDGAKGYLLNVASYQNGVGFGRWVTISGFSESVFTYMKVYEDMRPDADDK